MKPRHPFQNILFRALFLVGLAALACNLPRRGTPDDFPPTTTAPSPTPTATLPPTASPTPPAPDPVTTNSAWTPVIADFDGVPMTLIPPGCFMMGGSLADEQPIHQQCFDQPFWIDVTETTNAQVGSAGLSGAPDQPRDSMTWPQARYQCVSRGARLPTEAEWEYAARGPDSLIYPWGNTFDPANAIYALNADEHSAPVGRRPGGASWVGALDMSGNLWEWTSSIYDQALFPYPFDPADGRENPDDLNAFRAIRGGSWDNDQSFLHAASRKEKHPTLEWYGYVGFRCVRPY